MPYGNYPPGAYQPTTWPVWNPPAYWTLSVGFPVESWNRGQSGRRFEYLAAELPDNGIYDDLPANLEDMHYWRKRPDQTAESLQFISSVNKQP